MKTLVRGCLLWALFSTVASLICNSCRSYKGPCLHMEPKVCPEHRQACADITSHLDMFGGFDLNFKTCVRPSRCGKGIFTTTTEDDQRSLTRVTCCYTDNCNTETFSLPEDMDMTPNGLRCSACFSSSMEDCDSEETAACIGEETKCLSLDGEIDLDYSSFPLKTNITFKGCTKPNLCIALESATQHYSNKGFSYTINHFECSDATSNNSDSDSTLPSSDK